MKGGLEWIKSHPAVSAVIAAAVFVATYLMAKSKSSASSASTPSGEDGLSQNDLEFMQIQAGVQNQAIQSSTEIALGQQNEQVESQYISTAGQVADEQTEDNLEGTLAGYNTEEELGTTEAGVYDNEISAEEDLGSESIQASQDEQEEDIDAAEKEINSGNIGGSQNLTAILLGAYGEEGAAEETEASEGEIQSQPLLSSGVGSVIGSSILAGLFA